MVRGRWCQSKNDSADIDNLFQLITSDWVSDSKSEKRRETIFNNVWKAGSKSQVKVTKSQVPCTFALHKRLGYSSQLHGIGFTYWMCACFLFCRYEAVMKDNDASFASLQDSNEKLCGFLDWLLDTIEVHDCNPRQKPIIAPSQQLDTCNMQLSVVSNGRCRASLWPGSRKRHAEGAFHKGQAAAG